MEEDTVAHPNLYDCKIALLAGGTSGEREISRASGRGAQQALEEAGFSVELLDTARKEELIKLASGEYQVAFLCLHGKGGEDGVIQGFLEAIGLPYTGSGVLSSALAMDKGKSKLIYEQNGIPTPRSLLLKRGAARPTAEEIVDEIGLPCVVKPATEGSALGVFIVDTPEEVEEAIDKAFEIDEEIVLESYIRGLELTAAVLGNDDLTALPLIEIIPTHEFYDFESKYAPGGSKHICPARIADELAEVVKELAMSAHKALGCRGMSRSDFILDEQGRPWMLETNTLPGMTGTSLLPDAARAAGISFPKLCTMLVELALEDNEC